MPPGVWPHLTIDPPLGGERIEAAREGLQVHQTAMVLRGAPPNVIVQPRLPDPIVFFTTTHRRSHDEQVAVF